MDKISIEDKIKASRNNLNHSDKITINKNKYVWDEALYCGRYDILRQIVNKHLMNVKRFCCVGEYSINQDKICLLSDGLEYFTEINKTSIEEQTARTLSHEIMHRILFYDHGEEVTRAFDNIAKSLRQYWMW